MSNNFSIELCSYLDFEGMVIDVSYGDSTVASVNYDQGIDKMEIEMLPYGKGEGALKFPMQEFLLALEKAKKLAIQSAHEDREREGR